MGSPCGHLVANIIARLIGFQPEEEEEEEELEALSRRLSGAAAGRAEGDSAAKWRLGCRLAIVIGSHASWPVRRSLK